jgi:hypothetical protein
MFRQTGVRTGFSALPFIVCVAAALFVGPHGPSRPAAGPVETAIISNESVMTPEPRKIMPVVYQPVRSLGLINFKNFIYPGIRGDADVPTDNFELRHGRFGDWREGMQFRKVSFGDISGDGIDEAIVSLSVEDDGSQARDAVYVFTLERARPKVIYFMESGDRAAGGLRQAYAKGGALVLELWGPGNTLDDMNNSDRSGLCCPQTFTRSRYRWREQALTQEGSCETLPNPNADANCPTCD